MTALFSDQTSRVGELVGHYRLVRFVGAGGMGEVYEARHTSLGTRQAIKFLRRDLIHRFDLYARFEQEARIAGNLDDPHIIKVHDFRLTDEGMPYMVMDFAEGQSLASLLAEQGQLQASRAVDLVRQACFGLCVAHQARIAHRDLKPENLYVCRAADNSEWLKILDFGIAKHLGAGDFGPTTETGTNLGTAHYMSPEQAQGARHAIDHRTDIYSLGVILYQLLSGKRPHEGQSYNEILIRIVTQLPIPLDKLRPGLPRDLVAIVARAMQRDPADRFQSARAFADALTGVQLGSTQATSAGIALLPATQPRSADLATLASHVHAEPIRPAPLTLALPRPGSEPSPLARSIEASKRTWYASLGLQFVLAIVAAAAVTSAIVWLPQWSRSAPASSPVDRVTAPVPHNRSAVGFANRTPEGATLADVAPKQEQKMTERLSSGLSAGGQNAGRSRALAASSFLPDAAKIVRAPSDEARAPAGEARAPDGEARAPKAPSIDEPLPASPHAPGVSPVME